MIEVVDRGVALVLVADHGDRVRLEVDLDVLLLDSGQLNEERVAIFEFNKISRNAGSW